MPAIDGREVRFAEEILALALAAKTPEAYHRRIVAHLMLLSDYDGATVELQRAELAAGTWVPECDARWLPHCLEMD